LRIPAIGIVARHSPAARPIRPFHDIFSVLQSGALLFGLFGSLLTDPGRFPIPCIARGIRDRRQGVAAMAGDIGLHRNTACAEVHSHIKTITLGIEFPTVIDAANPTLLTIPPVCNSRMAAKLDRHWHIMLIFSAFVKNYGRLISIYALILCIFDIFKYNFKKLIKWENNNAW